jgi:hypothetical protein
MRRKFWNSWSLVHPFPQVSYVDGSPTALVTYGGATRELSASFRRDREPRCLPDELSIPDLAARFPKGRKLWNATLIFHRELGGGEWRFWEVYIFQAPLSSEPAEVIGFLGDYSARDRGVGGLPKDYLLDRARAGRPDGPAHAEDVGRWYPRRPSPYHSGPDT